MAVSFATRREDFPPNLSDLRIERVTLYFAKRPSVTDEAELDRHLLKEEGAGSTRLSNAGSWASMIGEPPIGRWTLVIVDDSHTRQ